MGGAAAILILLASAGLSPVLAALARRRMRVDVLRQHHDVGSTAFLQLGVLYAASGIRIQLVWQEYNVAQQAIALESSGLHGAAILTATLPAPTRGDIERAVYSAD